MRQDSTNDISPKEIQEWTDKFPSVLARVSQSNFSLFLKLEQFLKEDVVLDTDSLPRGALWHSLRSDPESLRSLLRIKQCRDDLRDIQDELQQLILTLNEVSSR